jgi:hypothetical protein
MWKWNKREHSAVASDSASLTDQAVAAPPQGTVRIADPTWGAQARFISLNEQAAGRRRP